MTLKTVWDDLPAMAAGVMNDLTISTLTGNVFVVQDNAVVYVIDHRRGTVTKGDSGTDDSVFIANAITAAGPGGTVVLIGSFVCTTQIIITKNINIIGSPGATIQWDTLKTPLFLCRSSVKKEITSSSAKIGDLIVNVNSVDNIHAGDLILISDDTIWNPIDFPAWKTGELHKVHSVSDGKIRIFDPVIKDYSVSGVKAITPVSVVFDGINISTTNNNTADSRGIMITYGADCRITNCKLDKIGLYAIDITNSYNTTISGCNISYCEEVGNGYGISINDATAYIRIVNNTISSCKHCIAHGGYGSVGQPRESVITDNFLIGSSISSTLDAHPIVESVIISNNVIVYPDAVNPNIHIGAKKAVITGNRIVGGWGISARGSIKGCDWIVSNNYFQYPYYGFYLPPDKCTWNKVVFIGNQSNNENLFTVTGISPIKTLVKL